MNVQEQRIEFLENGYAPIPLHPRTKDPSAPAWQRRPTISQWHNAAPDSNIGLRAGNGRAFIDCDDKNQPGTYTAVTNWMDGLGHSPGTYPVVRTPNMGAHIYVNFTGAMLGSSKKILPGVGAGEFRFGTGAQVATFPSVIDEGVQEYRLICGNIARLPELDLHDVAHLISINLEAKPAKTEKKMSHLAYAIANGTKPDRYQSNSEGEVALILSLINSRFTYEEIKRIFNTFPCLGHYKQKHLARGDGDRWFYAAYQDMLNKSHGDSETYHKIVDMIENTRTAPWSNANRKKAFLAHLTIAKQAVQLEYDASLRDLALLAGIGINSVITQNRRLVKEERIQRVQKGSYMSAARYKLNVQTEYTPFHDGVLGVCIQFAHHDAFRNGSGKNKNRLGRRAGDIYELIFNNPLPLPEIVKQTGACRRTVKNALKKMQKQIDRRTGEVIEMVTCDGDLWHSNLVDLDIIAIGTGSITATYDQRMLYDKERREHKRSHEISAAKKDMTPA